MVPLAVVVACSLPAAVSPARRALGWEFSLMLAVGGAWLIIVVVQGVVAVPFIMLWLVVLRGLGWLPRLARRRRARGRPR